VAKRENQKKLKAERNEAYAKKHRPKGRKPVGRPEKKGLSNWCRMAGHPRSCEYATCPSNNP